MSDDAAKVRIFICKMIMPQLDVYNTGIPIKICPAYNITTFRVPGPEQWMDRWKDLKIPVDLVVNDKIVNSFCNGVVLIDHFNR